MLTMFDITSQLLFSARERADALIGFLIMARRRGWTSIAFLNSSGGSSVTNPAWDCLDAAGEYQIEAKPRTEPVETFVLYAVVASVVGQKTIAQEAP